MTINAVYEQNGLPIVATADDLRAMRVYPYPSAVPILFLKGITSDADGNQGFFQWVDNSSATDDNLNTIQSNWITGNGRWVRLPIPGQEAAVVTSTVSATVDVNTSKQLFDCTSGNLVCTYPRNLGNTTISPSRWIGKTDTSANTLIIQDDNGTFVDIISTPAIGGAISGRWVFSDGTNVWSQNV